MTKRRLDVSREEIQIEGLLVRWIKRLEPEMLPPTTSRLMQSVDDHRAACCLGIELQRRRKYVRYKRCANAQAAMALIDREPT